MTAISEWATAPAAGSRDWQQMAFALALVERMRPNFALFCEVTGHDGLGVFSNILGLVKDFISGTGGAVDFDKQQAKLEQIIPDPQHYDVYGVWPALDATTALAALLSCCQHFDEEEVGAVCALSAATIEGFLEATEGEVAPAHPLIAAEQAFGAELQSLLAAGERARADTVAAAVALARESGVSNIGLAVD